MSACPAQHAPYVHPPHDAVLTMLDAFPGCDVIMTYINYVSRTQGKAETELLPIARKRGIGIVAMKVFGGGRGELAKDYDRAYRYALSVPGVACAVLGTRTVEEVRRAARAAKTYTPLSNEEMQEAIRLGQEHASTGSPAALALRRHALRDYGGSAS